MSIGKEKKLNTYLKIDIEDIKRLDLKSKELIIYSLIKSFGIKNKSMFMSRKVLSKKYGMCEKTVSRTIKKLEEKKLIEKDTRPGMTNKYILKDGNNSCDNNTIINCYDVFFSICNSNEILILSCIIHKIDKLDNIKNKLGLAKRTILDNVKTLKEKDLIKSNRKEYTLTDKTNNILNSILDGIKKENKKEDNQEEQEEQEEQEGQEESQEEHKEEVKENSSSSAIICNFKILEKEEIKDIYNNMSKCQNALTLQEKINFIISLYNQKYTRYTPCEMLTKEEYNKLIELINNYDLSYIVKRLRAHLEDIKTKEKYNNSYQLRYVITNITHIKVRNNFTERLYFDEDIREVEKNFYI